MRSPSHLLLSVVKEERNLDLSLCVFCEFLSTTGSNLRHQRPCLLHQEPPDLTIYHPNHLYHRRVGTLHQPVRGAEDGWNMTNWIVLPVGIILCMLCGQDDFTWGIKIEFGQSPGWARAWAQKRDQVRVPEGIETFSRGGVAPAKAVTMLGTELRDASRTDIAEDRVTIEKTAQLRSGVRSSPKDRVMLQAKVS